MEPENTLKDLYYFAVLPDAATRERLAELTRSIKARLGEAFQPQQAANLHCSIGNYITQQLEAIAPDLAQLALQSMGSGKRYPLPEEAKTPANPDAPLTFRVFRNMDTEALSLAVCFEHPTMEAWQKNAGMERPPLHVTLGKITSDLSLSALNAELAEGAGMFESVPGLLASLERAHQAGKGFQFDSGFVAPAIMKLRQDETGNRLSLFSKHAQQTR